MNGTKITIAHEIIVRDDDIDDLMVGALEGGITYWCDNAEVIGEYLGTYGSEQISRGGRLLLHDFEGENQYVLNREKFLNGLRLFLEHSYVGNYLAGNGLDCGEFDAIACDMVIQYALFGDVIYG